MIIILLLLSQMFAIVFQGFQFSDIAICSFRNEQVDPQGVLILHIWHRIGRWQGIPPSSGLEAFCGASEGRLWWWTLGGQADFHRMVGKGGNGGVFVSLTKRVMSPDVRRSWAGCVKWKSVWFTSGCCKIWKVVGGNELIGLSFWDTQRYWLVWPRRKTCLEMRWQQLVAWRWKWLGGGIPWHFQRRTAWGSFWHDGHPKDSWTTGCSWNTEVQIATIGGQIPLAAVQLLRLKHWSMNQTWIYTFTISIGLLDQQNWKAVIKNCDQCGLHRIFYCPRWYNSHKPLWNLLPTSTSWKFNILPLERLPPQNGRFPPNHFPGLCFASTVHLGLGGILCTGLFCGRSELFFRKYNDGLIWCMHFRDLQGFNMIWHDLIW